MKCGAVFFAAFRVGCVVGGRVWSLKGRVASWRHADYYTTQRGKVKRKGEENPKKISGGIGGRQPRRPRGNRGELPPLPVPEVGLKLGIPRLVLRVNEQI